MIKRIKKDKKEDRMMHILSSFLRKIARHETNYFNKGFLCIDME